MSNSTVRDGIVAALTPRLHTYRFPVDSLDTPCAVISDLTSVRDDMDDGRLYTGTITVLVSHSNSDQLELLDDLVDADATDSIPQLLEASTDIEVLVKKCGGFSFREWAGVLFYGAQVDFEVLG